jgi:hypothetical protein
MRRNTACLLAGAGCLFCLIIETSLWGFQQGLMTLGLLTLLVFPAGFVSPRRNQPDRIWIIVLLGFLLSFLKAVVFSLLQINGPPPPGSSSPPKQPPLGPPPEVPRTEVKLLPPGPKRLERTIDRGRAKLGVVTFALKTRYGLRPNLLSGLRRVPPRARMS